MTTSFLDETDKKIILLLSDLADHADRIGSDVVTPQQLFNLFYDVMIRVRKNGIQV